MIAAALAYWQAFGLKKHARAGCFPYPGVRRSECSKGVFSRINPVA